MYAKSLLRQSLVMGLLFHIPLSGCENENNTNTESEQIDRPAPSPRLFSLTDVWQVSSKQCGTTPLPQEPNEAYKVDTKLFIRVEKHSEDSLTLCRIGYVFERIVSGFDTSTINGRQAYSESGILMGNWAKKSCYRKEGERPVGKPFSDEVVSFGPEKIDYKMIASDNSLNFELTKSSACPNDTLNIELHR